MLRLAARQHGLATRKQLAALGLTESGCRNLVERGEWRWRSSTVLQVLGSAPTTEQELLLHALDVDVDAAISHETSMARWGTPGFSLWPVHVTGDRVRGRRRKHLAIVHQPRLLQPEHVIELDGIRTTTPTRTLFDLAGVIHPGRLERALDNALASGLTSIPLLNSMLNQLACRGRKGITLMRALLEARPIGYVPPASGLESRFQQLARRAGWWTFSRQINVGDEHSWLARVDFVEREQRIIVEVQSDRFHTALLDREADKRRIALLSAAGWTVLEVKEHDLWHNPDKVIRQLQALQRP